MKKNEKLLKSITFIDDKYVEEASPVKVKKKRSLKKLIAIAACACFILAVASVWLFTPYRTTPGSVSQYSDSEYYPLIEKINAYTFVKPIYKNNMEMLIGEISDFFGSFLLAGSADKDNAMGGADMGVPEYGPEPGDYVEVTDNQVSGVIEADLIKRTESHIFRLHNGVLSAYTIAGELSAAVGSYSLTAIPTLSYRYTQEWEFFLSLDGRTATVIATGTDGANRAAVTLISLDVSDPSAITEKGSVTLDGSYVSSRMVDGELLVMSEYYIRTANLDYSEPQTFVPCITTSEGKELIPADGIVSPDKITSNRYTVITKLDADSLALLGSGAFLSYSDTVYVSQNAIYAARQYLDRRTQGDIIHTETMTEISALSYTGDELQYMGSVTVSGSVLNQYSMDEYEGTLRVAASVNRSSHREFYGFGDTVGSEFMGSTVNSSLYVIDLETFEICASVECFAPTGETVRSARFKGNDAYICTSIMLTDPVYVFDLSDLENITEINTGTITGFSSSLVDFGDFLLGIGVGDSMSSLKVEMYEQGDTSVNSVDSFEKDSVAYSANYKAYYIDRENGLIGLAYEDYYTKYSQKYLLLYFDGYRFHKLLDIPMEGNYNLVRGVYIDGFMYIFGDDFHVARLR